MNYFIMSFIGLALFSNNLLAQQHTQKDSTSEYTYGIGAGAGFTTGYGLSFRYFHNKWGAQVNFAPYQTDELARYSAGITFLYYLIRAKNTNLFLYQGNHYYYNKEYVYYADEKMLMESGDKTDYKKTEKDSYFNDGLGVGIEFIIAKRIAFDLMAGYAFYDTFKQVNFTGETGLYFRF